MKNHLELRIYPSRKHILMPSNTFNTDKIIKRVKSLMNYYNVHLNSDAEKMYDQIRTFLSTNINFCLVKDKETNEICIYEFDVNENCSLFLILNYFIEYFLYAKSKMWFNK